MLKLILRGRSQITSRFRGRWGFEEFLAVQIQIFLLLGKFVTKGGRKRHFLRDVICERHLLHLPKGKILLSKGELNVGSGGSERG